MVHWPIWPLADTESQLADESTRTHRRDANLRRFPRRVRADDVAGSLERGHRRSSDLTSVWTTRLVGEMTSLSAS